MMAVDREVLADLLELGDGDCEFLCGLVERFLDELPDRIDVLQKAVDESQPEVLAATAHYLKSSTQNLGAKRMCELCIEMMALGREHALEAVPRVLSDFSAEWGRVQKELMEYCESVRRQSDG